MFQKATKTKAKLRLAIYGTAGSGKTFSALRIATGIGGKIALIDTERGSANKYADRFEFDIAELDTKDIESYTKAIKTADGYDVLIIDSLSHAWQDLLDKVEKIAQARFRGNTWSAWSVLTPQQRDFIDSILNYNGHIIATMRCKTEWALSQENGKSKPTRIGLAPEQGKNIEYEFDLLIEISPEHFATILKDRTGKYQDKIIEKPGEEFGKELKDWLNEGAEIPKKEENETDQKGWVGLVKNRVTEQNSQLAFPALVTRICELCRQKIISPAQMEEWLKKGKAENIEDMKMETLQAIVNKYTSAKRVGIFNKDIFDNIPAEISAEETGVVSVQGEEYIDVPF